MTETKQERGKLAGMRKRLRMTQGDLAAKVGVDRSEVAHWESGKAVPGFWRFRSMRVALGVTADQLEDAFVSVFRRRQRRSVTNGRSPR